MTTHLTHAVLVAPDSSRRSQNRAELHAKAFLARYRADNTRRTYGIALRQWFRWCEEHDVDPLDATRAHIEIFARELEMYGRCIATIAGKLNTLQGFYRFAHLDGLIDKDPMVNVARPKVERKSTRIALTRFEVYQLLEVADEQCSPQDCAFVTLLAQSGLRNSEACGIDVEDLGEHRGQMSVDVHRKGDKDQVVLLSYATAFAITRHLREADRTSGPVFVTGARMRFDRKAGGRALARVVAKTTITKRITPHSLRHSWCTMALDAKMDHRDIQAAGGWADSRMMHYYDHGRDDIRRSGLVANGVTAWIEGAA